MTLPSVQSVIEMITDFLSSAPTAQEIITFRLPEALQSRLHELLEFNSSRNLTEAEQKELDEFLLLDHIITLIKAKTRLKLQDQTPLLK